jgi:hypothetical protein
MNQPVAIDDAFKQAARAVESLKPNDVEKVANALKALFVPDAMIPPPPPKPRKFRRERPPAKIRAWIQRH